ncbi:MAG: pyrimidine dimer DNA glycosylase/endonuclease V [Kosmotogaceae bacterium]
MRLWSISPKYLDAKGLVALWREGLLAKCVLEGKTRGYKNHPQLIRFKKYEKPLVAINSFLYFVVSEAQRRNYNFDIGKLDLVKILTEIIPLNRGQLMYEFNHLCKKLKERDLRRYQLLCQKSKDNILINPIFYTVEGQIEVWERVK